MDKNRTDIIKETINQLPFVHLVGEIQQGAGGTMRGEIDVDTKEGMEPLKWKMDICQLYPMKAQGHDSIRFSNKNLMEYPHIMEDANLCLHSEYAYDLQTKLTGDLTMLKKWVNKYYVNGERDEHYEHLIVNTSLVDDEYYCFQFAETERCFQEGDYGVFGFGSQLSGLKNGKHVNCYSIIGFKSYCYPKSVENPCKWEAGKRLIDDYVGVYCFLKAAPDVYGKFIIKDYEAFNKLMSDAQIKFVNEQIRAGREKWVINRRIAMTVGYTIPSGEVQWQTMLIPIDQPPFAVEAIKIPGTKQKQWIAHFIKGDILWGETINCSYEHFFGRGAYPQKIVDSNILIIGVGAIGSMIAVALTRCGARKVTLYDYDDKMPGNICRSEYTFVQGTGAKVYELSRILQGISPFIKCKSWDNDLDRLIKKSIGYEEAKDKVREFLNEFDIIFDCSTDNDMMRCLDLFGLESHIVNLSITNHAKELVCGFSPHVMGFVEDVYTRLLSSNLDDVFNPTGCWNPTFKASYTDIACMVELAMKHIVKMLSGEEEKKNFVIVDDREGLLIKRL